MIVASRWKKPERIITDGARNFREAYRRELWEMRRVLTPVHVRKIRLEGKSTNNKMEKMNGEVRDREKVMRGLKNQDYAILNGYQIFHNFIRPHDGLEGKT
ncbi:MAG: DDE-type integrase/transposase/recombinase, partial [Nitrososphaerales archaeon]